MTQAVYEVLMGIYASDAGPYAGSAALRENLQAELTASLAEIPDGGAEKHGIQLGHYIAWSILAQRADDGWDAVVDPQTEIGTDPGEWRPTPPGFANPLAPHWGSQRKAGWSKMSDEPLAREHATEGGMVKNER